MWKQEVATRRGIAPHLEEKQWEEVQKKTFQGWINMHLEKRGMRVQNLDKDLADGVKLINLLEILHGGKIEGRYYKNPKSRPYKIDNVNFALSFITDNLGVKLFGCSAEDLVDGNLKIILGMLWRLIQHFQLTDTNSRQIILDWCKKVTAGYPEIRIENFHDSFADGLFFCSLVHQADPSLLNYQSLDKTDRLANIRAVFDIAEKNLSIPQLLDPADVVAKHVDERSVLTYVSMWYERFKTISLSGANSASSAPATSTSTSSTSSSTAPTPPASELQDLKEENTRLRQELEDARDSLAVAKQAQIRADNAATEALQRATKAEDELTKAQEAVTSAQTQVAEAEAAARTAETARAQAEVNAAAAVVAAHSGSSSGGEGAPSGAAEVELAIANATVKLAETKASLAEAEAALATSRKEEEESKAAVASAKAQIQELHSEAEAARERLTDLEQKVVEAETKLEALFVQVGEAKSKLQEATDAHSAIETKRYALQAEVDAIQAGEKPATASKQRSTGDGEDSMVADTLQEKIMAEQQLEEVQERLKEAEDRLRNTQSKLDAASQELSGASGSSDATRSAEGAQTDAQALEDAKEEITVLKKKFERAQAKALKSQKKKYTTRIKSRDKELKTLREQTEIDLKAKDDEIDRLKTQLAKAQKALGEASTSDATEVNADVELLKTEYSHILAIAKLLEEEESNTRTQRRARNSESEDEDGEREADE